MRWSLVLCLLTCSLLARADALRVAIVLDDMGNDVGAARQALTLPSGVALAILPDRPASTLISELAHAQGREVLLHQPMQSIHGKALGNGGLTLLDSTPAALQEILQNNLRSVPHAVGINNHMGSMLTRSTPTMQLLMRTLKQMGTLYFLDSRTDPRTVAQSAAQEVGLPNTRRDVFLDNQRDPVYIRAQLNRLLKLARERGSALAIGHPYPETLAVLQQELPKWRHLGIDIIPPSQVISWQRSPTTWHASSYPSPKVAKNSKQ